MTLAPLSPALGDVAPGNKCVFCSEDSRGNTFKNTPVCPKCKNELSGTIDVSSVLTNEEREALFEAGEEAGRDMQSTDDLARWW